MAIESPEDAEKVQRNMFLESLAPAAKERFLETLEVAASRGLSEEAAWQEAAAAAQLAYSPD